MNPLKNIVEKNAIAIVKNPQTHDQATRPAAACPCGCRHWWLDAYSQWACVDCQPPAAPGQVRDQVIIGAEPPTDGWQRLWHPDGRPYLLAVGASDRETAAAMNWN
jgi:hypothetical protein